MSVVGKEYELVVLDLEVEAAVHASVCLHSVAQLIGCAAIQLCHCHCSHTVGDVDWHRLSEFYACHVLDRRDEVECDSAILYLDVLCVEVAFVLAVFVYLDAVLHVLLHLQVFVDDEGTARLDQFCVVAEAFQISLLGAVDVEVVWVGRCDDAHPWAQPVEAAVELICLDYYVVALVREDVVGAVILGNTTQEGIAIYMALVHDVGAHGRC